MENRHQDQQSICGRISYIFAKFIKIFVRFLWDNSSSEESGCPHRRGMLSITVKIKISEV
jgi:hypothetical protein